MALILVSLAVPAAFAVMKPVEVIVGTAREDLAFSEPQGYDLVEIRGDKCGLSGDVGEPWLPVRNVHVLLPPGAKAAGVTATVLAEHPVPGRFRIFPAQLEVPTSATSPPPFVAPKASVYASRSTLRAVPAELVDTMVLRGYRIAVVQVYPVAYTPATGQLSLRSRIRLHVHLETRQPALVAFNEDAVAYKSVAPEFEGLVRADVINPGALSRVGAGQGVPLSPVDPNDVKYLLVGDAAMFDEFQPLLDWKTQKGVPAEAVDVAWIYANYTGEDNQERIKACIKDYVENRGTVWVVLAGDNTIVPDRDCYGSVNGGDTTATNIPTDLYYAGLDDMDWDDDDDNVAAEVNDDTIDMGPDVYVGRIPIRTEAQATAVVNKTLDYEKNAPATGFAEDMVLTGVRLWDPGDAEGKNELMYTGWIDPHWDPVRVRFYDTNTDFPGGASYQVSPTNMDAVIGDGYNFLHMATHGSSTIWSMETGGSYSATHALAVSNPGEYVNILTIACTTNAFDLADPCLSEGFLRNPNGGAVSYSGSSRYGWGYYGVSTHGSSFRYNRMFYEFLFTGDPASHPQQVGAVHTRMKENWVGSCNWYGSMRWCQFTVNLMGDPEFSLYTCDPLTFVPAYLDTIPVGSQTYVVETGVDNALVCLAKDTEVYAYGYADGTGHFEDAIAPTSPGTMTVTITAPNYDPHEGAVTVAGSSAGVVYIQETVCKQGDTLHVGVIDTDLAGAGTQNVAMTTAGGDSEALALTETGPSTGIFEGTIDTAPYPIATGNATLEIAHAETITATYQDLDDGTGSPAAPTDTATADCQGPAISNVQISNVRRRTATVTFDTDDEATARVRCGETPGGPYPIVAENLAWGTSHTVQLTGLTPDTTHFFEVDAFDRVGNQTTDDNGGACYTFTTLAVVVPPFCDDFEAGHLDYWDLNEGGSGDTPLVAIDSTLQGGLTPQSGVNVAYLGDATYSNYAESTMDLELNLAGMVEAELSFWWVGYSLWGSNYIRLDLYDGVWHEDVNGWAYQDSTWEQRTLDLADYNLIDGFVVRFRSNMFSIETSDAAYVDDVCVTGVPIDDLVITPPRPEDYVAAGPEGGPFTPPTKTYALTNTGAAPLAWLAAKTVPWLEDPSPAGGAIAPLDPPVDVTVAFSAGANSLAPGNYTDTVTFRNDTSGIEQHRDVFLEVRPLDAFTWSAVASPQEVNVAFPVTVTAVDALGETLRAFTGAVNLEGIIGAGEILLGTPEWPSWQPFGGWSEQMRCQIIYVAGDIGGPGTIRSVAFDISRTPLMTYENFTVRMQHTPLDEYTDWSWADPAGWVICHQSDLTVPDTGWLVLECDTPFEYDGVDNLMVDFSYNNPPGSGGGEEGGECTWFGTPVSRAICGSGMGEHGDPLDWTGNEDGWPWMGFEAPYLKLDTGVSVQIAPTVSDAFVDGEWAGAVTVLEPAVGMHLLAKDSAGHKGDSNDFDVVLGPSTPLILNVDSPHADGAFTVGEIIDVDVVFSMPMTVTGVPTLTLETGDPDRSVDYAAGEGTDTLTFTYVVAAGEETPDLDYADPWALDLNGGTIRDAATGLIDAYLKLPEPSAAGSLAANRDIEIDTSAPVVGVDVLFTNDSTPELTGSVNEASATVSITVDLQTHPAVNNGDGTWTLPDNTLGLLDDGTYDVAVAATDPAGNVGADATLDELAIDATAPVVAVDALATTDTTPELTGAVDDPAAPVVVTVDGQIHPAVNHGDGTWTLPDDTLAPLAEATYDVQAEATDAAANTGTDSTVDELKVDLTPPSAAIVLDDPSPTGLDVVTFSVDFDDDLSSALTVGDVAAAGTLTAGLGVTGTAPAFTVTATLDDPGADGTLGIVVSPGAVADLAGNPYGGGASPLYTVHNWFGFTEEPADARRYVGEAHQLRACPDCGNSAPAYAWWHDDGSKTPVSVGDDSDTLVIDPVTADHAGQWWCDVTYDACVYTSTTATLSVAEHLAITGQPQGADLDTGDAHTFSVATGGGFAPLTYLWKKDDTPVGTDSTYALASAETTHAGAYRAEVADDHTDSAVSDPAVLTVAVGTPVAGFMALGLLAAACAAGGIAAVRRRNG